MAEPEPPDPRPWTLRNEFAAVEVRLDVVANSARLRLTDLRTGRVSYVDPLVLERLCWAGPDVLAALVASPSDAPRWRK